MDGKKRFDKICQDIKAVRIQGAESVAKAGIRALLIRHDKKAVSRLLNLRPTEPLLQNSVKFIMKDEKNIKERAGIISDYLKNAEKKLAETGKTLIKKHSTIFLHCHSSSVTSIILAAKSQKPEIIVTETRPLFQGRKTAAELAKAGINVKLIADVAARTPLRNSDMFLFGADAINHRGIINKIGTALYAELAKSYKIPCYSCAVALKYSPHPVAIEQRPAKEILIERRKKLRILNPAFEVIGKNLVTGIVSELGILSYQNFLRKVVTAYPSIYR